MKTVKCENCLKKIKIPPSRFKNKSHSCSRECRSILASKKYSKKIKTNCKVCGKEVEYKKSHYDKIKNHTCSIKCSSKLKSSLYKIDNPNKKNMTKYARFFWDRFNTCTLRALKKGLDCNIDYLYLKEIYESQKGLCYYSNIKMRMNKPKDYDTASVDRLDSSLGYVKGNIVWCLNSINTMKSNYDIETIVKIASGLASTSVLLEKVKIKKIRKNAQVPERSNKLDAGFDLYVSTIEDNGDHLKIGFGVSIEPPNNLWFMAAERSSLYKKGLSLANKVGILDQPYRGEIMGIFYKNKNYKKPPKIGNRLVQIIPQRQYHIKFEIVDELDSTERGSGGFGSTDTES